MLERTPFDFDPSSRWTALASGPETVSLWRGLTEETLRQPTLTVETKRSRIVGLALVDSKRMITVHDLGEIVGWSLPQKGADAAESSEIWSCDTAMEPCAVAAHRQGRCRVVIGGRRGRILVLSPTRGLGDPPLARLNRAHRTDIVSFAFSEDGTMLASSGRDRRIGLWDVEPNGDSLLTEIPFDRATGGLNAEAVWLGSAGWPLSMVFEPGGDRLVSGAMDNGVYLWDDAGESPLAAVRHQHSNWVADVDWSDDGKAIASAGWDASVVLYQAQDLQPRTMLSAHTDIVTTAQFQPESSLLVTAGYDGNIGVWNWRDGVLEHWINAHSTWIEHVVPDGRGDILTVSSSGAVRRWSLEDGEPLGTMGEASERFELGRAVDFSEYLDDIDDLPETPEDGSEPALPETHVRALEADSQESDAERSAVGLLEDALPQPEELDSMAQDEDVAEEALAPSAGAPIEDTDVVASARDPEHVVDDLNLREEAPEAEDVAASEDDASASGAPDLDLAGLREAEAGSTPEHDLDEDLEIAGTDAEQPAGGENPELTKDLDLAGADRPESMDDEES
jgi:WD40 repeat protein